MSAVADLRDHLEEIHEMLPLSDRERTLAQMVLYGDGEVDMAEVIRSEPKWWGAKALKVLDALESE